jgi:Ulp1 family protease
MKLMRTSCRLNDASTVSDDEFVSPERCPAFSVKVPQQKNLCDCGVYMLHFLSKFVTLAPAIDDSFIEVVIRERQAICPRLGHTVRQAKGAQCMMDGEENHDEAIRRTRQRILLTIQSMGAPQQSPVEV